MAFPLASCTALGTRSLIPHLELLATLPLAPKMRAQAPEILHKTPKAGGFICIGANFCHEFGKGQEGSPAGEAKGRGARF